MVSVNGWTETVANDALAALRPRQRRFLEAYLSGLSLVEAARVSGVSESTARRWLRDPAVRQAVRQAQREIVGEAVQRLAHLSAQAVATLADILTHEPNSAVRLRAVETVLANLVRLLEVFDLHERIEALEQAVLSFRGGANRAPTH